MFGAILAILLVVAGLAMILGAQKFAWKLILVGVVAAVLIPVLLAFLAGFWGEGKNRLVLVIVIVILLALVMLFNRTILKVAWTLSVLYVKLCFRLGVWFITTVTRFPWVLLPQPEKLLTAFLVFLALQATFMGVLLYLSTGQFPWITVIATWLATMGLALLGRWRYLRKERQGLAHV